MYLNNRQKTLFLNTWSLSAGFFIWMFGMLMFDNPFHCMRVQWERVATTLMLLFKSIRGPCKTGGQSRWRRPTMGWDNANMIAPVWDSAGNEFHYWFHYWFTVTSADGGQHGWMEPGAHTSSSNWTAEESSKTLCFSILFALLYWYFPKITHGQCVVVFISWEGLIWWFEWCQFDAKLNYWHQTSTYHSKGFNQLWNHKESLVFTFAVRSQSISKRRCFFCVFMFIPQKQHKV